MPRSRRNTVTRRLADGSTKTYRYEGGKAVAEAPARTLGTLIQTYRQHSYYTTLAPSTQETYRQALRILEGLRHFALATFASEDIEQLREELSSRPGMANLVLAVLGKMLRLARKLRWMAHNPIADVDRFESGEGEPWPGWAIDQFREKASAEWVFVMDLTLMTAQRRSDVIAFRWKGYDGAGIAFTQKKTGTVMWVPVPQLVPELDRRKREAKGLTIVTDAHGRPYTPRAFSRAFSKAVADAGLAGKGLKFHGLRHTTLTWAAENGATAHDLAALGGHQSLQDVKRYTKRARQKVGASRAASVLPLLAKRQNGGQ